MGNQQVTDAELGWLAGMIDGDGSVAIQRCHHNTPSGKRGYYSPRCQVANTDPAIIAAAVSILERLGIGHYVTSATFGHHKQCLTVRVDRFESIERLLDTIGGYLCGEKKSRAILLLKFVRSRMSYGKNMKGNKCLNVPYTSAESAMAEQLLHGNLNDYTRDAAEVSA